MQILEQKAVQAKEHVMGLRSEYIRRYPGRNVPVSSNDNAAYDKILNRLSCDDLEVYREQAGKQAKAAVEHLRTILCTRSAVPLRKHCSARTS